MDVPRTSVLNALLVEDIPEAISLAKRSYSAGLIESCLKTLRFHEACLQLGLDDGRRLYKYVRGGRLIGVCGLHRQIWGPPDCAWFSWFFIDPSFKASPHAFRMFLSLMQIASEDGLDRLYVETPSDDLNFARAGGYLVRLGFIQQAVLPNYYVSGVDMLVFSVAVGAGRDSRPSKPVISLPRERG